MIKLKTPAEVDKIRRSGQILKQTIKKIKNIIKPGVTTKELDDVCREYIFSRGAKPAFLGYLNYPASICISVNEEVIHGIPGKRRLRNGDLVSLDLGVVYNGFFSDAAITIGIGQLSKEDDKLLKITEECLELGIKQAVMGNRIGDISQAIYNHATKNGYEVVRQFCGHGLGFELHEDPQIPNYMSKSNNQRLKAGMVIAIEPMINQGTWEVKILEDEWTVVTVDGEKSAHFEHTIAIFSDHTEILT